MKLRVAIVDDEPYSREMFSLAADLEKMDMELVASLENPETLLDHLEEYRPDIVVTDIRMQEMDGLELIRRIQERKSQPPGFILLSAYSQVEYAKRAIQLGVKYYVIKPYLPIEINGVLEKLANELRESRQEHEKELKIDQSLLGRRILRLIYDQNDSNTSIAFPAGIVRYCAVGLFSSDAVSCIRDITIIHQLLADFPQVAVVIRQPMKVEFAVTEENKRALEITSEKLQHQLEKSELSHDYYAALGPSSRNWQEVRASWHMVEESIGQAVWREDRHWMCSPKAAASRLMTNRLPEIIRAMVLGEREASFSLIREQLHDYRKSMASPYALQLLADQLVYRSLSVNVIDDSSAMFSFYETKLQNLDKLYVDQVEALLLQYSDQFIGMLKARQAQVRVQDDPLLLIRTYIDEHYSEQLTVQKIAEQLYFHPAYIGVLFKKNMGVSIHRYLHQVRIGHAVELMQERKISLTQIALDVGYNDYPSFITAFRQIQGVSPSAFLKVESVLDESPRNVNQDSKEEANERAESNGHHAVDGSLEG